MDPATPDLAAGFTQVQVAGLTRDLAVGLTPVQAAGLTHDLAEALIPAPVAEPTQVRAVERTRVQVAARIQDPAAALTVGQGGLVSMDLAAEILIHGTLIGDSELCGTAIECSLTGTFQLIVHKRDRLAGTPLAALDYPLLVRIRRSHSLAVAAIPSWKAA